jgi:Protein of unknown function (DUF3606)
MLDRRMAHTNSSVPPEPHYSSYPERINIDDEAILARWSQRFTCSPERLKEAVAAVGDDPRAVEAFLANWNAHPFPPRDT